MCYQFRPEIYGLQEQMGIADFSRMTRPFTIEPGGLFKCEDIGLVVQELTESIET